MRGRGAEKPGNAPRARSPHCCAVLIDWPLAQVVFHSEPSVVAKHPNGTPMNAAPALNTSGKSPSSTLVIIAPDDAPVTNTRLGSALKFWSTNRTMDTMPAGSLVLLWVSDPGVDTSKQAPDRVADG